MAQDGRRVRDLQRAIREVQIAQAERDDVIVELRETERARLALLAEALDGVFDALPADGGEFALAVLPADPPRFWVDATSFVMMGRDKRTYRFLKDTRLGRTVITETADVEAVADAVTRYVAERIVERQRALEAEWVDTRTRRTLDADEDVTGLRRPARRPRGLFAPPQDAGSARDQMRMVFWAFAGFGFGVFAGIFLLLVYAWVAVG